MARPGLTMIPTQLHTALYRLHWTQARMAAALGVEERTLRYWLAGERRIPSSAAQLIRAWVSGALVHPKERQNLPHQHHKHRDLA
jgi:transcriptional regulator with XRE-family HTH domain